MVLYLLTNVLFLLSHGPKLFSEADYAYVDNLVSSICRNISSCRICSMNHQFGNLSENKAGRFLISCQARPSQDSEEATNIFNHHCYLLSTASGTNGAIRNYQRDHLDDGQAYPENQQNIRKQYKKSTPQSDKLDIKNLFIDNKILFNKCSCFQRISCRNSQKFINQDIPCTLLFELLALPSSGMQYENISTPLKGPNNFKATCDDFLKMYNLTVLQDKSLNDTGLSKPRTTSDYSKKRPTELAKRSASKCTKLKQKHEEIKWPIWESGAVSEKRRVKFNEAPGPNSCSEPVKNMSSSKVYTFLNSTTCKFSECVLGNIITDSFVTFFAKKTTKGWTSAAIALLPGLNIQDDLNCTLNQDDPDLSAISEALPDEYPLVHFSLSGVDLHETMRIAMNAFFKEEHEGVSFLQVSGIHLRFNPNGKPYERIDEFLVRCANCRIPEYKSLDHEHEYRIIAPLNLIQNNFGHNVIYEKKKDVVETAHRNSEVFRWYLSNNKRIIPEEQRRIRVFKMGYLSGDAGKPENMILYYYLLGLSVFI